MTRDTSFSSPPALWQLGIFTPQLGISTPQLWQLGISASLGGHARGGAECAEQVPTRVDQVYVAMLDVHTLPPLYMGRHVGYASKPWVCARRIPTRGRERPRVHGGWLPRGGPRLVRVHGTGACHAQCSRMGVGARSTSSSARRPRMGGNRASGVHMVYAARFLYVSERIRILEL